MASRKLALWMLSLAVALGQAHAQPKDYSQLEFYGFDTNNMSDKAKYGLETLYKGKGFQAAVPQDAYQELDDIAANLVIDNPIMVDITTPEGHFKAFGRMPSPQSRQDVPKYFPLSLSQPKRIDPDTGRTKTFINHNCFQCHSGVASGIVTAGLGNAHVDQTSIKYLGETVSQYYMTPWPIRTIYSKFEEEQLADFRNEIFSKISPTFQFAKSRGENYGPYAVWMLLARLIEPNNTGLTPYPLDEATPYDYLFKNKNGTIKELPPIDPGPWWNTKYKKSNYWYADDISYDKKPAHFAINFTSIDQKSNALHPKHVTDVSHILDFVYQTTSPPYPKALDADKVKRGAKIFHGELMPEAGKEMKCYKCHGEYTAKADKKDYTLPGMWQVNFPEKFVDAKTDSAYNDTLQSFRPLVKRASQLSEYFEEERLVPTASVPSKKGYMAPPLVGVWASAPYFHNGSVPTLWHVLKSDNRPTYWQQNNTDPFAYDHERVGLTYTRLSSYEVTYASLGTDVLPTLSHQSVDYRAIYDTTRYGRGNQGHTYGDSLTAEERMDVIEFLKSLSGPDM